MIARAGGAETETGKGRSNFSGASGSNFTLNYAEADERQMIFPEYFNWCEEYERHSLADEKR